MAEQELDRSDVGSVFEQVNGKGAAQRVRRDRFRNAGVLVCLLAHLLDGVPMNGFTRNVAGKQPVSGPFGLPPVAQDLQ